MHMEKRGEKIKLLLYAKIIHDSTSDGSNIPGTWISGFGSAIQKWVKGNKAFIYLLSYLMIFQTGACRSHYEI